MSLKQTAGIQRMSAYRMYFRTSYSMIPCRLDFQADDDVAAIRIARALFTCSDVCQSFELWQGAREIHAQQPHHPRANLIEAHQRLTIETEEAVSQSLSLIARSQCLIETLDRVKSKAP